MCFQTYCTDTYDGLYEPGDRVPNELEQRQRKALKTQQTQRQNVPGRERLYSDEQDRSTGKAVDQTDIIKKDHQTETPQRGSQTMFSEPEPQANRSFC